MLRSPAYAALPRSGECDQCHDPSTPLFAFEDDEPGDYEYCKSCIRILALNRRRRLRAAQEEAHVR